MNQSIEIPTLTLEMMMGLTEAELKTLLAIIRHTTGAGQDEAALSYVQIACGTYGADGRLLMRGSGLCHKSIGRAIRLLKDKSYITVTAPKGYRRRYGSQDPYIGTVAVYGLGQRMRPLREWAGDPVVPQPEPIPFRPRRLKVLLDAAASSA